MGTEAVLTELVARIKADTSQLDKALADLPNKAQASTAKLAVAFGLAGYAGNKLQQVIERVSFVEWTKGAIEGASRINDLSLQIDFTAASLVNLQSVLIKNGSNLEQFTASVNIMNANLGAAGNGAQDMIQNFDRLGLSVTKLKALGPEKAFYAIVDALSKVQNQSEQTELGRAILGRGFASMIPTIKDVNGKLGEHIEKMNALNGPVLNDAIKHLDEVGDRFDALGNKLKNNFMVGLSMTIRGFEVLNHLMSQLPDASGKGMVDFVNNLSKGANDNIQVPAGIPPEKADAYREWYRKSMAHGAMVDYQPTPDKQNPAAGSNADLAKRTAATKELTQAERDAQRIIDQTRSAQENYDKEMANATALLNTGKIDLVTYLRYQHQLQEELDKTGDATDKAAEKTEIFAKIIKDHIGDAFESALFDAGSFSDSLSKILDGIARQIARTAFINPLSDSLSHLITDQMGGGIGGWLGGLFGGARASGGPVSGGRSYLVGENGPEIFRPGASGGIVANDNIGGTQIHVTQIINVQTGVAQTVRAEMLNLLPSFKQQAISGVAAEIQNGGGFSRLVRG